MSVECPECQFKNPENTFFCGRCGTKFASADEDPFTISKTLVIPAKDLVKGQTFADRYQIIQELGRGGMGVVYKAQDTKLKRTVALKFLPQELTHLPDVKDRFMVEAQAAAALDHPHICTVYEFDEAEEKTFISMAFIEGQSLKAKLDKTPTELNEALKIAIQVAEGLQEAHKKGVIHRDIKSANIIVSDKGQATIMDFGLARMSGGTMLTKEGMTMGTVAYMSPEQARGEEVDHRTDIWSLGVVLYEMFGGQLPFKGEHEQTMVYSIFNEDPQPLAELNAEIPISLEQVVAKSLEKNPDERYQSAEELLDDLRSILDGIDPEGIKARVRRAKLLKRKRAILYAGTAVILIILAFIALSLFTGKAEAIDAIAVLPFENLTGDEEQEFFVDGVTDELIGRMTQIGALRVIPRRSAMEYKGVTKSLSEIAQELKVDAVVEGSVQEAGENVRLRVQLIEVAPEERNLWAQTYSRDMANVLVMYGEIARTIAEKIQVELTPQEETNLAGIRQVNPEAYEAFVKGRFHWYRLTREDLELALNYFELAREKDPNYALAYAGITGVWGGYLQQGLMPNSEAAPKAREARVKALELGSDLAEVQFVVATNTTWMEWEWEDAEKAFKRAIELNPNYPDALIYYAHFLLIMRRPEEATPYIDKAMELDPFSALFRALCSMALLYADRHDDAIDLLQETLRTSPNASVAVSALKSVYHEKKMYEEALEIWRSSFSAAGDLEAVEALDRGYAEGGYSEALSRYAELQIERSRTTYVTPWRIATLYTRAGKKEEALEWLEKAYVAHDSNMPYISVDPIFDYLRDDPRFIDILRRMNLPLE